MKKLIVLIALAFIIQATSFSQPCLPQGITFTTQAQIDNFQTNHPNCTEIEGDVIIGDLYGGTDITNLNGLSVITSIGGELYIDWNMSLNSFTGLDNVTSIGGNIGIYNNSVLTSFTGLENLISIEGGLSIGVGYYWGGGGNPSLTSLSGLDNIEAGTIDHIAISNNVSLSTCEVQSVCDYLALPGGYIEIHDNATGCNSVEEVKDSCVVASVDEVQLSDKLFISPNPFSTSTTIEYELQHPTTVQITIYNHLGKQIEIIQQTQSAGKQQVVWNAEGLPSGVYFCVLKTDPARVGQTLKMIKSNH